MAPEPQQQRIDDALDRIEKTILPCIAMMLDTLLDAAQVGDSGVSPQSWSAELRMLALQLEALTREIESVSPVAAETGSYPSASAGGGGA